MFGLTALTAHVQLIGTKLWNVIPLEYERKSDNDSCGIRRGTRELKRKSAFVQCTCEDALIENLHDHLARN